MDGIRKISINNQIHKKTSGIQPIKIPVVAQPKRASNNCIIPEAALPV
jgi:hypothetical protein